MAAALDLALVGPLEGDANSDDLVGAQHLQLEVCVVGDGHELRVAWSSQDGVESFGEHNHVEGEGLGLVIELIPKGDGQIDLSQWHGLFPGHDAMKRRLGWAEVRPVDAHLVERLGVHDVEATAPVHQYLGEPLWTDDRIDDQRIPS